LAPTILAHLGVHRLPAAMRGAAVRTDGGLRSASQRSLMARLRVIGARRLEALAFLLCGWAVLLLAAAVGRGPGGPRRRAWALRAGALAVLAAAAAATYPVGAGTSPPSRRLARAAIATALAGALLVAIEGWARIGAAVGGVVLVCVGAAIATVTLLPARTTRRRALLVLLSPIAGLATLAALDLAAAHG